MPIVEKGNGWHKETLVVPIATLAAIGRYVATAALLKPGNIIGLSSTITYGPLADASCVTGLTIQGDTAVYAYGTFSVDITVYLWQFDAVARTTTVVLTVLVSD